MLQAAGRGRVNFEGDDYLLATYLFSKKEMSDIGTKIDQKVRFT